MTVTQKDIAEKLGVTRVLVSRALAGHSSVAERTQVLVRETARQMGYHDGSNAGARALAARRNGRLMRYGVIACSFGAPGDREQLPYWALLQQGVEEAAREADYRVVLSGDAAQWDGADGIISHGPMRSEHSLPGVTLMDSGSKLEESTLSVTADDFRGARDLVAHLLSLGHKRIACLMDVAGGHTVSERVRGWKYELKRAGISADKTWLRQLTLEGGEFLERGRCNMRSWLQDDWKKLGCTALIVQNDRAAIGAMQELQAAGIAVPQQVSVAGFDGAGENRLCTPQLTTVEFPLRQAGQRAVELLLQRIENRDARSEVLSTTLLVGDSTGLPPKR
jgi:DNA-binding LacI/PurR family transcriptional regulator